MNRYAAAVPMLLLIAATAFAGGGNESSDRTMLIGADELERLMSSEQMVVLDIRDDASYREGHIPGAELVPLNAVEQLGPRLVSLGLPIVTYCSCPAEESSLSAALTLRDLGADRVYVLQGGYRAWSREGKPIIRGSRPL